MPPGRHYHKGLFVPKNPSKYRGNVKNIRYRSAWEKNMFHYLDNNTKVVEWSSEEINIPYSKPVIEKIGDKIHIIEKLHNVHKYYPDIIFKQHNAQTGKLDTFMVEIKPDKETKPPKKSKKPKANATEKYLKEYHTFAVNSSKWKAASKWCERRGINFVILTEKIMPSLKIK